MLENGVAGVGISAHKRANDLSDFGAELDMIEALGVDYVELPTYEMDIVVGGRIRRPQLDALKSAVAGRKVGYSVHGPLAINFMHDAWRLPRHMEVLKASLEVAAEVGARNYVLHSGITKVQQSDGIEDAYARQREWLAKAGDLAADLGLIICVETMFGEFVGDLHVSSPKRLATELAAVNHANIRATIDFSHSWLKMHFDGTEAEYIAEIAAIAPFAQHLHIHDSFGRQDDIWMFTPGEALAYGHGDLHLPVGWGNIPWTDLMAACAFPKDVLFNIELNKRFWYAADECVAATRDMMAMAHTSA